jgi:hypothetical protein
VTVHDGKFYTGKAAETLDRLYEDYSEIQKELFPIGGGVCTRYQYESVLRHLIDTGVIIEVINQVIIKEYGRTAIPKTAD